QPRERTRAGRRRPCGRTSLRADGREDHPGRARIPGRTAKRHALVGESGGTRPPGRTPRIRSRIDRRPPLDRAASFRVEPAVDRAETLCQTARPLQQVGFASFGWREASRRRADRIYKTSRTFTATMKAKTTRSGLIGTRSVWDRTFERMLPDSSAWALVSSRIIRNRMRAATAASPKLTARNVDVTVTTVVIMRCPFPFNKFVGWLLYINTSPRDARFVLQPCVASIQSS